MKVIMWVIGSLIVLGAGSHAQAQYSGPGNHGTGMGYFNVGPSGAYHGRGAMLPRSGMHRMGHHDYDVPGHRVGMHAMGLNYGGFGGYDGMGGSVRNLNQPFYPQKPYYIPDELRGLPVGTVYYWVDGFYEIYDDGYMYKESK